MKSIIISLIILVLILSFTGGGAEGKCKKGGCDKCEGCKKSGCDKCEGCKKSGCDKCEGCKKGGCDKCEGCKKGGCDKCEGCKGHENHKGHENKESSRICRGILSDTEYLEHMIPHHQVAVDISILLQKKTKSPAMHEILRNLIWTQNYEIELMKRIKNKLPRDDSIDKNTKHDYIPVKSDYLKPNEIGLTNTYCDPHFFDPEAHMKHMENMELNDKMYIEHMIPHHQVAVDMSKVLLKNTKNGFMIYLAYRIIRSQQAEIVILDDLLKSEYVYQSELLN
jgi:uncharacterized protein (DUF305 family)